MFKKRFTNWIPMQVYDYSGNKYLLLGRRKLKTGMVYFKNKKLNTPFNLNHTMPVNIFDVSAEFKKLFIDA